MSDEVRRKGIVLAGGWGTRLHPLTLGTSKQLLPVYDKPLVYYPLSVLMLSGIRDILLISTPSDIGNFEKLFGDGSRLGLRIVYEVQPRPGGLAQAFVLGRKFIGDGSVALVLGDNILYGDRLEDRFRSIAEGETAATIFAYEVGDPKCYGVVELDNDGRAISIEEKPVQPKSNYAVPGLYFYDNHVVQIAANLKPSERGELEITDVNREYLRRGQLDVQVLGRDVTWLDVGTPEALRQATDFVFRTQQQQRSMIACPEEIACRRGYISAEQVQAYAAANDNDYGRYLSSLLD
ncbi:MAG: glucose-1-phosphate thymidylyltransferase [Planctomycetaceae bacterium]|nr:glucose-1-phosphate thymidylyltransferase [Planctomycetaceae bacterium]